MKSTNAFGQGSADNDIECTAADWLGRRDGGLTAEESRELEAWLKADPRHAAAFAGLEAALRSLDRLASLRPPHSSAPDPDLPLLAQPRTERPAFRRTRRWIPLSIAAAAAVLALASFTLPTSFFGSSPAIELLSTEVGEFRKCTLPDESIIELNTDSRVEVVYSGTGRRVKLVRGEAYFTVAKDPSRPFIVTAGNVGVRAVGTAFNVRLRPEAVDVIVTEGRIRVDDAPQAGAAQPDLRPEPAPAEVTAGERAVIRAEALANRSVSSSVEVQAVDRGEMDRLLAWQDQRLEFGPTPLRDIVAEFNRYNRQQLVVADEETGALSVGGTFRAHDPNTLVHLLQTNFGIVSEKRGRQTILRRHP
ncbi:MAG: FecR domain-containing protein [Opitutaceae bacterium]